MDILTRAFLALRVPIDLHPAVANAQLELRRRAGAEYARWTSATDWNLILCALGEVSPPQLAAAAEAARAVAARHAPLGLVLEGIGGSPNATQPRFAWVGIGGAVDALNLLHADLEAELAPLALPRESRPLQAHVPLGRLKVESEQGRSALGRAVRMASVDTIGAWSAGALELLKTEIGPTGPMYATLQTFEFQA